MNRKSLYTLLALIFSFYSLLAQINVTFPAAMSKVTVNGTIENGIYLVSAISDDNDCSQYFLSCEPKSSRMLAKTLESDNNVVEVSEASCLWKIESEGDDLVTLYSVKENKYLVRRTSGLALDKTKKNADWRVSFKDNNALLLKAADDEGRALGVSSAGSGLPGFNCYKISGNAQIDMGITLYKASLSAVEGEVTMPADNQRLCLSTSSVLRSKTGEAISRNYLALSDGSVAQNESIEVITAKVISANTFYLSHESGYLSYDMSIKASPSAWQVLNGHLCTVEDEPRYLCYDNNVWKVATQDAAKQLVGWCKVADTPNQTLSGNGVCTLTGGWTAENLAALSFSNVRCLDLSQIALPCSAKSFENELHNCPIFVNENSKGYVPSSWRFVVLCSESGNKLNDPQLKLEDKYPFFTDRAISVKAGQVVYERTDAAADKWQTISVPFDATVKSGAVYELTNAENNELTFNATTDLLVPHGYIAKADALGCLSVVSKACKMENRVEESLLRGTNEKMEVTSSVTPTYMLHPVKQYFVQASAGSTLQPFRAYLQLSGAKMLRIRVEKH